MAIHRLKKDIFGQIIASLFKEAIPICRKMIKHSIKITTFEKGCFSLFYINDKGNSCMDEIDG